MTTAGRPTDGSQLTSITVGDRGDDVKCVDAPPLPARGRRLRLPPMQSPVPADVDATLALLESQDYVADRRLATAVFLALKLRRPLFLEGEAGVGKTEIAKVL